MHSSCQGPTVAILDIAQLDEALSQRGMHKADYEEQIHKHLRIFIKKIEKDARGD
jgi:hypothetical protein